MSKDTLFVGLDVHSESISVAVAGGCRDDEVRYLGRIPNTEAAIRKLVKKHGPAGRLRVCYEAGPCGYVLYWLLTELGVECEVIAPTLIPEKAGDRVKTDRRDAMKLARCHRAGDLTAVYVPTPEHEALRDLLRCLQVAKADRQRSRQRLGKFLLRRGRRRPSGIMSWGAKHLQWLRRQRFELQSHQVTFEDYLAQLDYADVHVRRLEQELDEAVEQLDATSRLLVASLQALRGVAKLTAVSLVAELGRISRFAHPKQLMGYTGLVPSEHSTGGSNKANRGGITRTGNAYLRRLMVESAWSYRYRPAMGVGLRKRQQGLSPEVCEVAWKAQHRLHRRYRRLSAKGKPPQQVVVAVARELLGFVWDIGVRVERAAEQAQANR